MVVYRTPEIAEAGQVAKLARDTFVETFGHLYSAENLALFIEKEYQPDFISAELQNPKVRYQIAEIGGEMTGLCKIGLAVSCR